MRWLLFILFIPNVYCQDIHFSQFDYNPVFQNPGNVGDFNADYRFHMNYRDQWRAVTVPFQTFSISAEARKIYKDFSIGMYLFNDVVGDGSFRTIEALPSISYEYKLFSDSSHVIRPGIQFGLNYRQFNANAFSFDSQWNGALFDQMLPTNEIFQTNKKANLNLGLGLTYQFLISERKTITAGTGFFNLNQPNQGFFGEEITRNRRFNLFARVTYPVGLDWDIIPSFQMNIQGTYREFIMGSQLKYVLTQRMGDYKALYGGVFVRGGDAGYILFGMEYQNWWGGVSYDFNFSKLYVASKTRGGLELSLRYLIKSIKRQDIFYRVCPDYI